MVEPNETGFSNARYDELFYEQMTTMDEEARIAMVQENAEETPTKTATISSTSMTITFKHPFGPLDELR
jgi:ABC-type transport system substrate-binding protein